ncbi:cardiolipin synthase [Planctomycetota bacterium]|nr:cardiolipin synthase [Planctomycetota bacterium]
MPDSLTSFAVGAGFYLLVHVPVIVRILIRPHREPASRLAWLLVVLLLPFGGIVAYILLGEVSVGHARERRVREVTQQLTSTWSAQRKSALGGHASALKVEPGRTPEDATSAGTDGVDSLELEEYAHLFRSAGAINGFHPHGGNHASLLEDSNASIHAMVADIDEAGDHVHLLFYIWLTDGNGQRVAEALQRAAARGVTCRAMVDGLGSRDMIRSAVWKQMGEAGVKLAVALPIGNPLIRALRGRVDLRNHRKIVVIDNRITYCGSQNCADPEFRVKAKFAPWVDAVMRFEGPVVQQNQTLFASDWLTQGDEDISALLTAQAPAPGRGPGFTALAFGTGPTIRYSAMPGVFVSLMYTARRELVMTTPYYVPTEPMQEALCACARRGVATTVVFPARNDSWIVGAASRSYYAELLKAGVKIREYVGGLLHTKSLTLDGAVSLIGSANADRRSFELNYENNILLADPATTAALRARQQDYIASSEEVTLEMVFAWGVGRRLWNNTIAMLGPIL